jgi:hypothetical protein
MGGIATMPVTTTNNHSINFFNSPINPIEALT